MISYIHQKCKTKFIFCISYNDWRHKYVPQWTKTVLTITKIPWKRHMHPYCVFLILQLSVDLIIKQQHHQPTSRIFCDQVSLNIIQIKWYQWKTLYFTPADHSKKFLYILKTKKKTTIIHDIVSTETILYILKLQSYTNRRKYICIPLQ